LGKTHHERGGGLKRSAGKKSAARPKGRIETAATEKINIRVKKGASGVSAAHLLKEKEAWTRAPNADNAILWEPFVLKPIVGKC